mmetsp:Transcript_35558/g.73150  ORF Transcript_35558/g.73150 Transcript_35558/m.73150 type:complete len:234 (+) Transcript_35558:53-754(+)|eukprot:CAMPEP_0181327042 /NCGR_PEP_ID=MMETSP1101-20121128/21861_1 /TAXON_ID=46948 /ORGANISM="Rhodomonas abbreviata, Strain Caron Lab Isolate" /LENGTH=233 /DNA_ID=CAMNT_0023435617 /DNA_START=48 /DNA_END=749 /DNA_ORIENTATION=-
MSELSSSLKRQRDECNNVENDERIRKRRAVSFSDDCLVKEYLVELADEESSLAGITKHGSPVTVPGSPPLLTPSSPRAESPENLCTGAQHQPAHNPPSLSEDDETRLVVEKLKQYDGPHRVSLLVGIILAHLSQDGGQKQLQIVITPLIMNGPPDTFLLAHKRVLYLISQLQVKGSSVHVPSKLMFQPHQLGTLQNAAALCLQSASLALAIRQNKAPPAVDAAAPRAVVGTVA